MTKKLSTNDEEEQRPSKTASAASRPKGWDLLPSSVTKSRSEPVEFGGDRFYSAVEEPYRDLVPQKALRWGGRYKTSLLEKNGDVREYTNEELGVHGLKEAFDETNGYARTWMYLTVFIAAGVVFFWLTIPLFKSYRDRNVITSMDTKMFSGGAPLPIITVCPHGSGLQCDCLLWRRLHCRYREEARNLTWMSRFDRYACWPYFDFDDLIEDEYPNRIDANCDDFLDGDLSTMEDTCGRVYDDSRNWSYYTVDNLYERVVARESSPDGPYLTIEEVLAYGAVSLKDKISFFRSSGQYVTWYNGDDFIDSNYIEWGIVKRCVQLRVPPFDNSRNRQSVPGAENGILVVGTGISAEDFPLLDMSRATAALDINVNYVSPENYNSSYLPVNVNEFLAISAGIQTTLEFKLERFVRKQHWGSIESRNCSLSGIPRAICIKNHIFQTAADFCNCKPSGIIPGLPSLFDCSASPSTEEGACVDAYLRTATELASIPLTTCPIPCVTLAKTPSKITTNPLGAAQILYLKNFQVQGVAPEIPILVPQTQSPTSMPSGSPSVSPSDRPSGRPSASPSERPSESPSLRPSESPSSTSRPSSTSSPSGTSTSTASPTESLTFNPTGSSAFPLNQRERRVQDDNRTYVPTGNITAETTVMLRVGLGALDYQTFAEIPALSLSTLFGAIGGNVGLWCGLSFSLMFEVLEYGLVALLYGNGYLRRWTRTWFCGWVCRGQR